MRLLAVISRAVICHMACVLFFTPAYRRGLVAQFWPHFHPPGTGSQSRREDPYVRVPPGSGRNAALFSCVTHRGGGVAPKVSVSTRLSQSHDQTPSPNDTFSATTAHKCVIFLWVLTRWGCFHPIGYPRKMWAKSQVKMSRPFPLQLGGGGAWRTHPVAFHPHQRGGDQRGASHQPQRKQTTVGGGQGRHGTVWTAVHAGVFLTRSPWAQVFRNPYHHGRMKNWQLLFGVEKRRWVQVPFLSTKSSRHNSFLPYYLFRIMHNFLSC